MIRRVMWSILVLLGILVNAIDVKCQSLNEKQQEIYKKYEDLVKNGKMTRQEAEKKIVKEVSLLYFAFEKEDIIKSEREIEFYGKVIDQNGESVEGALIACSYGVYNPKAKLGDIMDLSKLEVKRIFTNKEGMFQLKTKTLGGITVEIKGRDGYDAYGILPFDFVFDDKGNYALKKINNETTPFKRPDPNNPEIFQIRKKGEPTIVITSEGEYNLKWTQEEENRYAICFICDYSRENLEKIISAGKRIDLIVTGKYETGEYRIKFKAEGEKGAGVLLREDKLYEAPSEGYQSEVEILINPKTDLTKRTLYLYARTGNLLIFSRLRLNIYLSSDLKSLTIRYYSYTNPYGERSFEEGQYMFSSDKYETLKIESWKSLREGYYPKKPDFRALEEEGKKEYLKKQKETQ